jgi:hypothetical protein
MFADRITALTERSDTELDAHIRELELARRRLDAELAATVAVADHRGVHLVDGHRSMGAYLRATCNWSNADIARVRSAARLVDTHPVVGDAWSDGRIGASQVAELARVHGNRRVRDRLGEFVPVLLEHAEQLPHREFATVVDRFTMLADVDGTHDDRDAIEGRTARVVDAGGALDVAAHGGDRLTTAEFLAIFDRFVDAEFHSDNQAAAAAAAAGTPEPVRRSRAQRKFDALISMARAAAAQEGMGAPSAEPLVSILCDRHIWSWVVAQSGLGAATDLTGVSIDPFTGLPARNDLLVDLVGDPAELVNRRCQTTSGVQLHPFDVLRAALSGHVRRVVLGARSVPINMGRSSRLFTGAARDAARLLVEWCDQPGCDVPASICQVDHSIEWADGGVTDQENAGIECGPHNRDKHRTKRRTRRSTNGRIYTFRPDGTIMLPVGCRPPPFDDPYPDSEPDDDPGIVDPDPDVELMNAAARNRAALLSLSAI